MKCLICNQPTEKKIRYELPNNPPTDFYYCRDHVDVIRELSAWFVLNPEIYSTILEEEKSKIK